MKTMTIKSATKKREALKISHNSNVYGYLSSIIGGIKTIRPCYSNGSGKWTTNMDSTLGLTIALNKMGIELKLTNDAPRGSKTGNLITIITKIR
jgi:hypothetical protein